MSDSVSFNLPSLPSFLEGIVSQIKTGGTMRDRTLWAYNLYLVTSGQGKLIVNDEEVDWRFGRVYLWQPGDRWRGRVIERHRALALRFNWSKNAEKAGDEMLTLPRIIPLRPEQQRSMKDAFESAVDTAKKRADGWRVIFGGQLFAILGRLAQIVAEAEQPAQPAHDRRLTLALNYMEGHLQESLSVAQIAEQASLSEDYFRRLFRERMKTSPIKFLTMLRVKAAGRLLAEQPGLTARAAARQVGLADERYFAKVFRRHFGVTPGRYRRHPTGPE